MLTAFGLEASIAADTVKVFPEDAKPKLKDPALLKVVAEVIVEFLFNKSRFKLKFVLAVLRVPRFIDPTI